MCKHYNIIFFISVFIFFSECSQGELQMVQITGYTQGTTYHISYLDTKGNVYQKELDSILLKINQSMSLYDSSSLISKINRNDTSATADNYFTDVFNKAKEISEKTNGAFDVTIAPLVNLWGFGSNITDSVQSTQEAITSMLPLVNYKNVHLINGKIIKNNPDIQLDFNAIAQGYTVDMLGIFLEKKGIKNYLVEIGGEVRAKGKNLRGEYWRIGIDKPLENFDAARPLEIIISLKNKSLATSGSYRKFYVRNGIKYSHTISPETGYPVQHTLLSASVTADNCMTADAYATAFMVMGTEKTIRFLKVDTTLSAFLIYTGQNGEYKTFASTELQIHHAQ